jgi:hypothetical protein
VIIASAQSGRPLSAARCAAAVQSYSSASSSAHPVAQIDDGIGAARLDVGQYRFQGAEIAMDIGDDCKARGRYVGGHWAIRAFRGIVIDVASQALSGS